MLNFIDQFEKVFYYSTIGMAILSVEGQCLKVNPALSKMTGYTEEELLSITFRDIIHPDDVDQGYGQIRELIEGKRDSYEIEKKYIHKNGDTMWSLLSVSAVREEDQPLFIISQVQDITERKQMELNLIESEQRFRNLIINIPDPFLVHDGEHIMYANPSAAAIIGTTVEEMIGMSIEEFIDPDWIEIARNLIQKILENHQPSYDFDFKIRIKNGSVLELILTAIPITFNGVNAVLVSYRDITERKKVEKALKESEERYRLLIDYSPLGIVVHQNRIINYANSTALRLLGANTLHDVVGSHINKFIHPDYQSTVASEIESIEKGGFVPTTNEKYIRLDGQIIDVEVNGIPIQSDGELAFQVVFWDVTERKREEDLVRYRAYHDTLTDLPNRLKFQLDLEEINKGMIFTVMYLDLHGLKPVNDTYGHQAGDMVLIKATSRLSGFLDSIGGVYRIGGDEFAVLLPGEKSEEEIEGIVNKMDEVIKQPIYISNTMVQVSASIGVVFSPKHGEDMHLLLRHADQAMYQAKKTKTLYKIYGE